MQKGFEAVEAVAPKRAVEIEPVDHGGEGIGLGAIVSFATLAAMANELGALEYGEVLGHSGLRDACVAGQGVDCHFALTGEPLKKGATGGIGEGAKDGIGVGRLHTENHNYLVIGLSRGKRRNLNCGVDRNLYDGGHVFRYRDLDE